MLSGNQGDGEVATEAVQLVADLVKRRKCIVPPTCLDCLLTLRFSDVIALAGAEGECRAWLCHSCPCLRGRRC